MTVKTIKKYWTIGTAAILALVLLNSCSNTNHLFYTDQPLSSNSSLLKMEDPILQPGDKISISIWDHEELSIGSINEVYNASEATGRWIQLDPNGDCNLPLVGNMHLSGFPVAEATHRLELAYSKYIQDPIINLRILNHFVSIMGEVNNPGRVSLNNEHLKITEVIALAQGLSEFAATEEIQLIRNFNGQSRAMVLDLSKIDQLAKNDLPIKSGDIIYVPAQAKKNWGKALEKTSIVASILASVAIFLTVTN